MLKLIKNGHMSCDNLNYWEKKLMKIDGIILSFMYLKNKKKKRKGKTIKRDISGPEQVTGIRGPIIKPTIAGPFATPPRMFSPYLKPFSFHFFHGELAKAFKR